MRSIVFSLIAVAAVIGCRHDDGRSTTPTGTSNGIMTGSNPDQSMGTYTPGAPPPASSNPDMVNGPNGTGTDAPGTRPTNAPLPTTPATAPIPSP